MEFHDTLYPELAAVLAEGLPPPVVPIIDAHMHVGEVEATAAYVEAARQYGATHALAMAGPPEKTRPVVEAFPDFFRLCTWPKLDDLDDVYLPQWTRRELDRLDRAADAGYVCFKMKVVPGDRLPPRIWIDDPRLAPIFERALRHGMSMQMHTAHPSIWWGRQFDPDEVRPKPEYFRQLENVLARYPQLVIVGCHMGGYPEDLDYLGTLFARFANFHIETSACKWVVRELSARPQQARELFLKWPDRILFGTDLVVQKDIHPTYYTSRFHVQRQMWETATRGHCMIKDPDVEGVPALHALDLPADVLRKLYRANAERIYLCRQQGQC